MAATAARLHNPPLVLLAEDDADTRAMYAAFLGFSGLEVMQAEDGWRALEAARRTPPDVVVTDIAMPRMDGVELCRHLRQEAPTHDVPVIMVSALALATVHESAARAGCAEVLIKPCFPDVLLAAVQRALHDGHAHA